MELKLDASNFIDPQTEFHYANIRMAKAITDLHTHNFYELFLVSGGEVIHVVNQERQTLLDGTLVFIRPTDAHCYESLQGSPCRLYNLAFSSQTVSALQLFLEDGFPAESLMLSAMPPQTLLSETERDFLIKELDKLSFAHPVHPRVLRHQMRALLSTIFTAFFYDVHHEHHDQETKPLPLWLKTLCSEMKKRENFTIGLPRLYELSHHSPEHISRMFAKHLGVSPTKWINEMRLLYAASLLANSQEDIISIAMDCGFPNLSHFYHQFKRQFQMSPNQYRKNHRTTIIP